jgi:serine/threonine protein kinase
VGASPWNLGVFPLAGLDSDAKFTTLSPSKRMAGETKQTRQETRTIGRYHVIAKLGQGGMANVFLTVAPGPAGVQKLLVVKELRAELAHDADIRTMFLDEARLAARLNHPNVVQTYEVGEDNGHYFIAMEYLEGQPFNRLWRRADRVTLPLEAQLRILADALGGLHYAHELADFDGTPLNVVHRDMSPHNVFVTYDGQVKVVDFGIAKAGLGRGSTKNGIFKGKATYASPEQALGLPLDRRSDLFSVGIMLWEALTQTRLWGKKPEVAVLVALSSGEWVSPGKENPDVPPALEAICRRAMARDPAERFATAAEFQHAIEEYLEASSVRSSSRQIAQFLNEHFREERSRIRDTVDLQVRRVSSTTGSYVAPPLLSVPRDDDDDSSPATSNDPLPLEGSAAGGRPDRTGASGAPPGGLGRAKTVMSAVGGAVAALVVVFLAVRRTTPLPPAVDADSHAATTHPAAPPGALHPDAGDRTVPFRVRALPAGAQLFLDDAPLAANPFDSNVPVDARVHRVRASEPGYESAQEIVSFDKPIDVVLTLKRTTGASPRPAAVPPPPPAPAPSHPVKPKLSLDEQDPYAR